MKNLDEFIFEKQLEDIYENLLNEDPINEGFIRNALRRAWAWLKSKFGLTRRKYSPYMGDYLAYHARDEYDDDLERHAFARSNQNKKVAVNIKTKNTINKLLDNSKLRDKLEDQNQTLLGAELYDDDKKMCGVLVYSPYKTKNNKKKNVSRFVILGLECLRMDDPELLKLLIEIANKRKCVSPMYVAKSEYMQNKEYYETNEFILLDKDKQTNLFYAYKEY